MFKKWFIHVGYKFYRFCRFIIKPEIIYKKKYSNREILLHHYFYQCCKVYPKNIIIIGNFIFFFVESRDYFNAKLALPLMRRQLQFRKILIIREEKTLLRLLYNFFPDPYVHDITVHRNVYSGKKDIIVGFLSFVESDIIITPSTPSRLTQCLATFATVCYYYRHVSGGSLAFFF